MAKRIGFILNFAPHYRTEIFCEIDKTFNADFYFGNSTYTEIKKMDYSLLRGVGELGFIRLFGSFYWLRGQVRIAFKDYDIYVITGQPYNLSSWLFLAINKLRRKRVFIWNHGMYGSESVVQIWLKKLQFKLVTGYLVYGNYAKKIMCKHGFKEEKLHVIYNSLAYKNQLQFRQSLEKTSIYKNHFKNDLPVVIFIGRLTRIKKLHLLIEAMRFAHEDNQPVNLVIVGDGEEKQQLLQLARSYNLTSQSWFYGSEYNEIRISELLYNADICVSPGNVGLTAIHALSYGCPVITHDNFSNQMPEFEAINGNSTGAFFKENNPKNLKLVIEQWLNRHPLKDKKTIEACYEVIDTCYNPNKQVELLKSLWS